MPEQQSSTLSGAAQQPVQTTLGEPPTEFVFQGRVAFATQVRHFFEQAGQKGWQRITLCDSNFEDWPLSERSVQSSLDAWAKTGRECHLIARDYGHVSRTHHRFVAWRQRWTHIVQAWVAPSVAEESFPSLLLSSSACVQRLNTARSTGVVSTETERIRTAHEWVAEVRSRGGIGFASSVLGL